MCTVTGTGTLHLIADPRLHLQWMIECCQQDRQAPPAFDFCSRQTPASTCLYGPSPTAQLLLQKSALESFQSAHTPSLQSLSENTCLGRFQPVRSTSLALAMTSTLPSWLYTQYQCVCFHGVWVYLPSIDLPKNDLGVFSWFLCSENANNTMFHRF